MKLFIQTKLSSLKQPSLIITLITVLFIRFVILLLLLLLRRSEVVLVHIFHFIVHVVVIVIGAVVIFAIRNLISFLVLGAGASFFRFILVLRVLIALLPLFPLPIRGSLVRGVLPLRPRPLLSELEPLVVVLKKEKRHRIGYSSDIVHFSYHFTVAGVVAQDALELFGLPLLLGLLFLLVQLGDEVVSFRDLLGLGHNPPRLLLLRLGERAVVSHQRRTLSRNL